MTELLHTLIEFIQDLDPTLRTLIAGFGMLLETSVFVGLVVPGDTIALVASLGVQDAAQFVWLVVALVVGALAGETIGFFLGRWIGPKLRASRAGRRLGERNWQLAEFYLGKRGGAAVFLSRFLPVLHSLIPLTAGMAKMRYRVFLAWTSCACVVWAVIVVTLGSGAAATYDQIADRVKGAGYVFVGIAVVVFALLYLAKRWLARRERRFMEAPDDASETE